MPLQPQGGQVRGTPIYEPDKYVLPDRVWFLRVSFPKQGIIFALVGIVFPVPVWSLDRVPLVYQLKSRRRNTQLHEKQIIC